MFVYDIVEATNEKIELNKKDTENVQYYGISGYTYYYGDSDYDNTDMMRKQEVGINYIVIEAFDGHGNTSEYRLELTMYE